MGMGMIVSLHPLLQFTKLLFQRLDLLFHLLDTLFGVCVKVINSLNCDFSLLVIANCKLRLLFL